MRWRTLVIWFLIAWGIVGAVLAIVSVGRAGIGWDAPIDVRAVAEIRAIPAEASLEQAYEMVFWTSEFYGLLNTQMAEAAHSLITGSALPLDASNLATYRWLAGVTLTISITGAAALGAVIGLATRSRLAGAFTWALIMTTPLLVGMSHVNFKDAPVAAGMSLLSAGLILSRAGSTGLLRWGGASVLLAAGALSALGARVGAWPLVLALVAGSAAVYLVVDARRRHWNRLWPTIGASLVGLAVAIAVIWATNPFAQRDLLRWLIDSFVVMREYPMELVVRVAGQDYTTGDLPWWYVPAWLGAQLPVLTTIAVIWGLVAVVASLARRRWSLPGGELATVTPILLQGVVLPVGIVVTGSVIYDGLRHVLFMVPALVAIAGIGIAALDRGTWTRAHVAKLVALVGAVAIALASGWATMRWLPYSYAFINPIAGSMGPDRAWELDYWGVTGAEGVRLLQEQGLGVVAVEPSLNSTEVVGSVWLDQAREQAPDGYGLYVFKRWDSSIGTCERLFTIERDGQVLGEGARCTKWDG